MKLINHVKHHRACLDMIQQDPAERVGVRRQTILAAEKGKYVPSALPAFQIADGLGMGIEEPFRMEKGEEEKS